MSGREKKEEREAESRQMDGKSERPERKMRSEEDFGIFKW